VNSAGCKTLFEPLDGSPSLKGAAKAIEPFVTSEVLILPRIGDKGAPYSTRWHQIGRRTGPTGLLPAVHRQEWRYVELI
jgi:hypothetical protein